MNGSEKVRCAHCRQVVPRRQAVLLVLEWEEQPGVLDGVVYFRCHQCNLALEQVVKFHRRMLEEVLA